MFLSSSFTDGRLDFTLPNVVGAPMTFGAAAGLTMLVVKSAGFTSVAVGLPLSSTVKYLSPTLVTGVPFLSVYWTGKPVTSTFTVVVVTLLPSLSTDSFVANLTFVLLPSAKRSSSSGLTFSSLSLKSAADNFSVCLPTTKPDF